MSHAARNLRRSLVTGLQWTASAVVILAATLIGGATLAGAFGLLPVLEMPLHFGDVTFPGAGLAIQAGLAILLLALVASLPSGMRVLTLERTHRDFSISMSDVAEAYRICHAADRGDAFTLSEQFDAVKERITYLRRHPDLGHLEPAILETAAEMSYASRDLAETYGDEAVARARRFLAQRNEEIAQFEIRLEAARTACREFSQQRDAIATAEEAQHGRLAKFIEEYGELLSELGFSRPRDNVIALGSAKPMAAE